MLLHISALGFLAFVANLLIAKFLLMQVATWLTDRNPDSPFAAAIGGLY